jgi:hypothetical protein
MYIPKNRIKTNLYTQGNEYKKLSNGEEYIGYYWSMYDGTFYSGKNPNDNPSEQIIKITQTENIEKQESKNLNFQQYAANYDMEVIPGQYQNMRDIDVYNNINEVDISSTQLIPQQYYPSPIEVDYENGFLIRYFACKINNVKYLELDKDTYTKMKDKNPAYNWVPYTLFSIQWTLVGEARNVAQANLSQIELVETRINKKGLKEFINNDFSQFYRPQSIQSNLITDGTVYKNSRTGLAYSGSYHIHPDKGPMVGAEHIKEYHDYLVPIS